MLLIFGANWSLFPVFYPLTGPDRWLPFKDFALMEVSCSFFSIFALFMLTMEGLIKVKILCSLLVCLLRFLLIGIMPLTTNHCDLMPLDYFCHCELKYAQFKWVQVFVVGSKGFFSVNQNIKKNGKCVVPKHLIIQDNNHL